MILSALRTILSPGTQRIHSGSALAVILLIATSAASIMAAPLLMPESYSWLSNTTSESAAQGVEGAWLARLGFLLFGLAVMWLSALLNSIWARGAVWLHRAFGVFMVGAAAFSHHPWVVGVPFDPIEDLLHSFTATAMGFAFAFGVLVRFLQREKQRWERTFDVIALVAATAIPLLMMYAPTVAGLLQRLMFLVAYLWYGREVLLVRKHEDRTATKSVKPARYAN